MKFCALILALLASTPMSASAATFEMNIGTMAPKGTPWMTALKQLEKHIESRSNGEINVIIRPPGMMAEIEMVRETRKGERLQACGVTTAAISEGGNIAQLQLLELPFLFKNSEEADYVLDNVVREPFAKLMARRGFVLANWTENGWRSFATKDKPIRTPADLASFKMRSQESDVHMAMYSALGATAIQKPMTEVLTSLQAGSINGLDNTALFIQAAGLAEPLDYFTISRHIYQPAAVVISKRWFDKLPPNLQAVVLEARQFEVEGRAAIRAEEKLMMENFSFFNVEVITLSDAERAAFATKTSGVAASIAADIEGASDLLNDIQTALKNR